MKIFKINNNLKKQVIEMLTKPRNEEGFDDYYDPYEGTQFEGNSKNFIPLTNTLEIYEMIYNSQTLKINH